MKKLKQIARFIVELILTLSIISFLLVYLISNTILNESYVLSAFEDSDYYNKIYILLQSNFENYIQQSGLDEKILENIVTKEQVVEDTNKITINIYDGLNEKVSTDTIKQKLEKNINTQIDTSSLNDEQKKAIDGFITKICDEYKVTISNSNYESQIHSSYKKMNNYINIAKKITLIITGISSIILILLNLRRKYKIVTNIATSMMAAGVILTICYIYINLNVKVQYLTILNDPVSDVIRNIVATILSNVLVSGIVLGITGLILIIVSNLIHNIVKYNSIMQDELQEQR